MISKPVQKLSLIAFLSICMGCSPSEKSPQQKQSTPVAKVEAQAESGTAKESSNEKEYVEQATFTDLKGDTVKVSDFKGKVVMIDFWETWCRPCVASFSTIQKLQEEYPDNFAVLAVTPGFTDTKEDARSFVKKHDYSFNFLLDSNKLHEKLGVQGIPFKVFVDAEGNFIKQSMGSAGPEGDYKMIKKIIEEHKKS